MKKLIFTFLCAYLLVFTHNLMGQNQTPTATVDYGLARVNKYNGIYVFDNCEPINDYEIVFDFVINPFYGSFIEMCANAKKAADKQAEKLGKQYDAIIIISGRPRDTAVRFKR